MSLSPSEPLSVAPLLPVVFNEQGLVAAIVQDAQTRAVLMLGYMNAEALLRTQQTGEVHFFSRSRQRLWRKGETSGNVLRVVEMRVDCDGDALLVLADPAGPTCHTGATSCFGESDPPHHILDRVGEIVVRRQIERPTGSYTTYLFDKGLDKICKKLAEEAAETIIAAKNADAAQIVPEAADLLYHLVVLLTQTGVEVSAVWDELARREGAAPRLLGGAARAASSPIG